MLTYLIGALPDRAYRWLLRRLGIEAGVHEFVHSFCPCGEGHETPDGGTPGEAGSASVRSGGAS